MNRRTYLKLLGASAGAAALAGCGGSPPDGEVTADPSGNQTPTSTPEPSALADRFDEVVDVAAAGADTSGGDLVDDLVTDLVADDTLLVFPNGRYRVGSLTFDGLSNVGFVGRDATFVVDRTGRNVVFGFTRVSDVLIDGLTFDATGTNKAAWCDFKCTGGENVIRDYTVRGFGDVTERTNGFTLMVEGKDTSLTLERVDLSDGALQGIATYVFPQSEFFDPSRQPGTLTFSDCQMMGWGIEGLYASPHSGPVNVIGGEYANNGIVQVRVGGGNAPVETVVRGVTVRIDNIPDYVPKRNRVFRGIWLKEGDLALVDDCDIVVEQVGDFSPGAIIVNQQFGRATIRNTRIRCDVRAPAIHMEAPTDEYDPQWMPSLTELPSKWNVTCQDLTIEGDAQDSQAILVEDRDGCRFENVTINETGYRSDGIRFKHVTDCQFADGSIVADRYPVVVEQLSNACSVRFQRTSLRGTGAEATGERLARVDENGFCVTRSLVGTDLSERERALALTQLQATGATPTAVTNGTSGPSTAVEPDTLYGLVVNRSG